MSRVYMSDEGIRKLLDTNNVILDGHFVLKNRSTDDDFRGVKGCGDHSGTYVNKDALFPQYGVIEALGKEIAYRFADEGVEVVLGLALGTIGLALYVRDALFNAGQIRPSCGPPCAVYAEEGDGGKKIIKRGFQTLIPSKRVLIVEDITTTGASAQAAADAVRTLHGEVTGMAVVCNRGGDSVTAKSLHVPRLESLVTLTGDEVQKWPVGACPLCEENIPISETPGHGKDFLEIRDTLPLIRK